MKKNIENEISRLKFNMQENTVVHNSYMREKRQLEFIRRGDWKESGKVQQNLCWDR